MLEMGIGLLFPVLSLISLIIFIIVLIKQFKHGGVLQGIIGIITCGLWTFIWGWIKHKSLAITKIMIVWTIIQLTPIVLLGVFGAAMMGQMYKFVSDIAGDPALLMKQDQRLKKKNAPIKLPQRTVQKGPGANDTDWNTAAQALWKDGQYTDPGKAKSYLDKAIAANPKMAESYNNRGLAFYNLEQHQQAINDFSQAIRIKPQYAEAFNNRGNAYYALDQYEQAEADFNQCLQIKPRYSKAHLNRGLVYFQMKKIKESCEDFRRACDLGDCDGLQWAMQNVHCK
ncbi:MAG: tetratricopeptide repeat protein [Deltaproteobacteria bacterium]|jgi:predicted Zn-dependent protease|nr:tetratricopeptide repeat protein [Deltaproteobacteria bacterium]